ncbi:Mor transcription activator family protein [Imhoffiella purpurea]|uniref:Mor transcription activator family protein n=1 Tax=Imhoffiella purpurea TaxID=1249627 RepID=UPI0005C16D0C|nr:Mor transcription activator family protein [Imhoffiella purpurea]
MRKTTEFIDLSRTVCIDVLSTLLGEEEAEAAADDIVYGIIGLYAGSQIYVSKLDSLDRGSRDRQIAAEYDGTTVSIERLSKKWNLSEVRIYAILRKMRSLSRQAAPAQ